MLTRDEHFTKINDYAHMTVGEEWEIDKETYWYFLECLPPLAMAHGCFWMSEFTKGSVTGRYRKQGDRYFASEQDIRTDPLFPTKAERMCWA